jgi:DNA-binding NarL/FixJ family response regulator
MSDPSAPSTAPSVRPLQLMLVDEDPVFRLGLKVWLEQQGDFAIATEAGNATEALDKVRGLFQTYQQSLDNPALRKKKAPLESSSAAPLDLIILDLGLGARDPSATPGLALCQQLKTEFPQLPVLVLSAQAEPVLQAAAERMGANGFGTRSMAVRRLAQLIRQVAVPVNGSVNGPVNGPAGMAVKEGDAIASSEPPPPQSPAQSAASERAQWANSQARPARNLDRNLPSNGSALSRLDDIPGPLTAMRISMRLSGLQQIDQSLAELSRQRTSSWLNQVILDGKKRELNAARWLVASIWRTPRFSDAPRRRSARNLDSGGALATGSESSAYLGSLSSDWIRMAQQGDYGQNYADATAARYLDRDSLIPNANASLSVNRAAVESRLQQRPTDVQNVVFEGVFAKLQRPLKNISSSPLEIDILRPDKKLELLYLVLRQLEDLLADLRASQVKPGQLLMRSSQVIHDLWDSVNTEFFGKYYTVRVGNVEEEVVNLLQREKLLVQAQILDRIPMVGELFGHWLFQDPMVIESASYLATTPQAIAYSERLLENLVIQVANAIMQPLLNRLADVEPIKKSLYSSRLMSSREIERFRNDLSWRYRWDRLVNEPKAIFESRYELYVMTAEGINITSIYAPRRTELDQLGGIPFVVTLAMETRDAIAPRLRTAISLVGSSVVYVLTEVLGRGIGLVGRGILQGVGSAWQDGKSKQRRRQNSVYREPPQEPPLEPPYVPNTPREEAYRQDFSEWE